MKKILTILVVSGFVLTASAQKRVEHQRHFRKSGHVIVSMATPYYYYYPYYSYGYWGYPFYAYPPYYYDYPYLRHESKLDLQIQDIRNDYQDRIWKVRHDQSFSRMEKKQKIHELKHQRDKAINNAERDYYNKMS